VSEPVVIDPVLGDAGKQAGMAHAAQGAGEAFRQAALHAIFAVAKQKSQLVSDDVWPLLSASPNSSDRRALGPAMRRAQMLGWIVPTMVFVLTTQAKRHRSPVRVWESRLRAAVEPA
jgi:pyridoxal/pyridoxine/pyridoxamine kinase